MPAPRPAPGRHKQAASGTRTRGQRYQNTFAYKHNKSSKKTEHILSLPVGGVCQRCYDQLMWRKMFRKFKPRTVFGKCNHCAKKNVRNSYCNICRDCSTAANCCAKCGEKKMVVGYEMTAQEQISAQQKRAYEMQFMRERERRRIKREEARANDKRLQRQLRRAAEGKSTDPGFMDQTKRISANAFGAHEDALGGDDGDVDESEKWETMAQPTDLESQVAVLQAYYGEVEASKTPEAIRAIVDARRGEEEQLNPEAWKVLCAKLQLKYPENEHPLAIVARKIEAELDDLSEDESDESDDEDFDPANMIGSEYADSLLDAMGDLGWETDTDATSAADADDQDEFSDDDGEFEDAAAEQTDDAASDARQARVRRQTQLSAETGGEDGGEDGSGATGVLGATVGASTTLYVAPQTVKSSGADPNRPKTAEATAAAAQVNFPRARGRSTETYLVEHLEQPDAEGNLMGRWCACEYLHMLERVGKDNLLITNISDADSAKWLGEGKVTTDPRSVAALDLDKKKVCLLDMRGELPLSAADAGKFDYILLGGILGDDPPQDRTRILREQNFVLRHLGVRQMTTNTALIVADKILSEGAELDSIPFIDDARLQTGSDPEVEEVTQLPFRYLIKDGEPLLAPGFLEYLKSDEPFF